jgi:hypothetical protein
MVMPKSSGRPGLPSLLLLYGTALAGFLLLPPFLKAPVGLVPGFTWQEATDLLTPIVVIPLAGAVLARTGANSDRAYPAFVVIAAIWASGLGMHLAANAIDDAVPTGDVAAFRQTVPGELTHWLDESLSHWMSEGAWVAMSVLVVLAVPRSSTDLPRQASVAAAVGGVLYGVTFFIVTVEGATTLLGIAGSVLLLAWAIGATRRGRARHPVVTFFLVGAIMTFAGYAGWAALNGGTLPEFTSVGLFS